MKRHYLDEDELTKIQEFANAAAEGQTGEHDLYCPLASEYDPNFTDLPEGYVAGSCICLLGKLNEVDELLAKIRARWSE